MPAWYHDAGALDVVRRATDGYGTVAWPTSEEVCCEAEEDHRQNDHPGEIGQSATEGSSFRPGRLSPSGVSNSQNGMTTRQAEITAAADWRGRCY